MVCLPVIPEIGNISTITITSLDKSKAEIRLSIIPTVKIDQNKSTMILIMIGDTRIDNIPTMTIINLIKVNNQEYIETK